MTKSICRQHQVINIFSTKLNLRHILIKHLRFQKKKNNQLIILKRIFLVHFYFQNDHNSIILKEKKLYFQIL